MIELGRFQIDLELRTLWCDSERVPLGSRAFDILAMVVKAGGRLVTKDELMDAVWPNTIVEENNIQVHLSALRKILGADRDLILTVPGRGYQLVQRHRAASIAASSPEAQCAPVGRPLPPLRMQLVGREADVVQIRSMLAHTRVLTLVGAGGIGKTSLAVEAARQAAADVTEPFTEPVWFVELATLGTRDEVLAAIAQACGLPVEHATPGLAQIASALAGRRLLVLDNAEHVIEHVAEAVEVLAAVNADLRMLVTSREPLRIMAEAVFRVEPLDVPQPGSADADILRRSAVNLFLLRANSMQREVATDSAELRLVGEICRRLDGIPLALELAAARVVTLGVVGVYQRLDDRLAILAGGYRTALPRHQTLRATFDWSFALLDAKSQALFRRSAVFGGVFSFEAMCAVACDASLTVADAIIAISELLAKSLVNVEFDGPVARYRLSESTRAYALDKLQAEGERQELAVRHARYLSQCFITHTAQTVRGNADSAAALAAALKHTLDDARHAYDWAFSPDGDVQLGVELASTLSAALLDGGMIAECCERATRAVDTLDALDALPAASIDARDEMRVRAALASALPHVRGSVSKAEQLWRKVYALATERADDAYHARALWGLWTTMISSGNIHASAEFAVRLRQLAQQRENAWQETLADQIAAISQHCLGRHAEAKAELLRTRNRFAELEYSGQRDNTIAVDPLVYCNGTLARIAWLEGHCGEAMRLVDTLVGLVRPDIMEPSLTHTLGASAAPLSLMCGDLGRAAVYLDIMRSQVALHGLDVWRDYCNCLSAHRDILDGQLQRGVALLESSLDALIARGFRRLITLFIAAYAEALVAAGRIDEAVRRLNDTLQFCENNGEMMFVPELWRVLGIAARARRRSADAEAHFTTAIQMARRQGATMWELRASLSLAALWREEPRDAERHSHALHMLERLALCFDVRSNAADVRALFDTLSTMRGAERTVSTASPMLTSPAPLDGRRKAARKPNASLARVD
ncbi:putative ATPase [Paraburkholderia sp. GV068]|jgi:predicted ATPase/DNA-binding winged helix-turn-helix (wHTH) protein|uniref:ATP-binding protein n=1 Tax=unclassified Paraburkholderia TaxID=2615204 RepID=UPI000D324BBE|nr:MULTISPECIES: winged helix-turn-helix domain-containing protein [unclassified Paraburkholderia]PTR00595.1 putative ATPase [Paraburkholderia sp. GV072]PUB05444.1 putative ATPase [Paraburkholderia sp. GV068]